MIKKENNKSDNEYISKYLAPLIEEGVITDVKEGEHSKIFFDLSKKIKSISVSCQLESSYNGDFLVFKFWERSKSGEGYATLLHDVVSLPRPDDNYHRVVEMMIKKVVKEFKETLAEQQAEEEKIFPIMKIN